MEKTLLANFVEFAEIVAIAVGTGVLSSIGIYLERLGVAALTAGEVAVGAWLLFMGLLALYIGAYLLGYDTLIPRVRRLLSGTAPDAAA